MNEAYTTFLEILENGTEAQAKEFIDNRLLELPEDLQQKIIFSVFETAVAEEAEQVRAVGEFAEEGLDLLEKLKKAKADFEEAKQVADLEAGLKS